MRVRACACVGVRGRVRACVPCECACAHVRACVGACACVGVPAGGADDGAAAASTQIGNVIKHALETSGPVGTLLNMTVK